MTSLPAAVWTALLMAASATPAARARAVIAVVAPADPDPAVMEALSRFRGEAASVGIDVTVVPGSPMATPAAQMEAAARAASAVATVAFLSGGNPHALDVWFSDRLTGQTVFGHVSVENEAGDRSSTVLAVKAVDFLRARMFDFLVSRPAPPPEPPPEPPAAQPAPMLAAVPARPRRIRLSAGIQTLHSLQGLGTSVLPLWRIGYDITAWSSLRLALSGFGTEYDVHVMGGSATVRQDVVMAEWTVTPAQGRVRPAVTLGVGVHEVQAEGSATPPYTARPGSRACLATALAAGLRVALGPRMAVDVEAGAFVLFPEPQIVVAGLDAGRTGRPGLSGTVVLEVRF